MIKINSMMADHLPQKNLQQIERLLYTREEKKQQLWQPFLRHLEEVSHFRASVFDYSSDRVVIGKKEDLTFAEHEKLLSFLKLFIPWKKGPFEIFGHLIDAQWRSDWKWQRLLPYVGSLKDHVIADIGAHNGYYMFRMQDLNPRFVLGFEPYLKHNIIYDGMEHWSQSHRTSAMSPLGVEHMDLFPNTFDTIFCLGILYHHTDPVHLLTQMRKSLKKNGSIFIDCQGMPGDEPLILVPRSRYAGARSVWHLPTYKALTHWIWRAGFRKIVPIFSQPLSIDEQRQTDVWSPVSGLKDFLDPQDPSKTIEGYPAPWRFYLKIQASPSSISMEVR